jgi:adenosine deaminase
MPKVELHIHLEGAFMLSTLLKLIQKYEPNSSIKSVEDLAPKFQYTDFSGFIDAWYWKQGYFRSAEDYELSVYETMLNLHEQHVCHVEPFYSPWDFHGKGPSVVEVTEAVLSGCRRAGEETGISWSVIADLSRDFGPEKCMRNLEIVAAYVDRGISGIGLGGPELQYPAELFVDVFAKARNKGFFLTAHAGEGAGAQSVRAAMDMLHVKRIGHGIRSIEDNELVKELARRQLPLDVCVTSNIKTGVVKRYEDHPIGKLIDAGVLVTINSDDPAMFDCTLNSEYVFLHEKLGFDLEKIRKLAYNGLTAANLSAQKRNDLQKIFDKAWR